MFAFILHGRHLLLTSTVFFFFSLCNTGDRTPGPAHAKQVFHHWPTSPSLCTLMGGEINNFIFKKKGKTFPNQADIILSMNGHISFLAVGKGFLNNLCPLFLDSSILIKIDALGFPDFFSNWKSERPANWQGGRDAVTETLHGPASFSSSLIGNQL